MAATMITRRRSASAMSAAPPLSKHIVGVPIRGFSPGPTSPLRATTGAPPPPPMLLLRGSSSPVSGSGSGSAVVDQPQDDASFTSVGLSDANRLSKPERTSSQPSTPRTPGLIDAIPPEEWTVDDVREYLDELKLADLQTAFTEKMVSGAALLEMTETRLELDFHIKSFWYRQRLMMAVKKLRTIRGEPIRPAAAAAAAIITPSLSGISCSSSVSLKSPTSQSADPLASRPNFSGLQVGAKLFSGSEQGQDLCHSGVSFPLQQGTPPAASTSSAKNTLLLSDQVASRDASPEDSSKTCAEVATESVLEGISTAGSIGEGTPCTPIVHGPSPKACGLPGTSKSSLRSCAVSLPISSQVLPPALPHAMPLLTLHAVPATAHGGGSHSFQMSASTYSPGDSGAWTSRGSSPIRRVPSPVRRMISPIRRSPSSAPGSLVPPPVPNTAIINMINIIPMPSFESCSAIAAPGPQMTQRTFPLLSGVPPPSIAQAGSSATAPLGNVQRPGICPVSTATRRLGANPSTQIGHYAGVENGYPADHVTSLIQQAQVTRARAAAVIVGSGSGQQFHARPGSTMVVV